MSQLLAPSPFWKGHTLLHFISHQAAGITARSQNPALSPFLVKDEVLTYMNFGGVRIEDNVLVTEVRTALQARASFTQPAHIRNTALLCRMGRVL